MSDPEKTVFLSYRREPSKYLAAYVYKDLVANGYDVFWDISGIDSGDFAQAILNQIAARTHFVLLLAPTSLARCSEPGDWLRREIEHAIGLQRNIVPVVTDGFSFNTPEIKSHLTGKLGYLPRYQALTAPYEYLEEAMGRLKTRFLAPPKHPVMITPAPTQDASIVERKKVEAAAQSTPTERQLTAEEYFQRGLERSAADIDGKIADYSEAIKLNPNLAAAYSRRAANYYSKGDFDASLEDCLEALRLDPSLAETYVNLGNIRFAKGQTDQAIADYTRSIELKNPRLDLPYFNRGNARRDKGDLDGAIADYTEVIRLNAKNVYASRNRGLAHSEKGNVTDALADLQQYLDLGGGRRYADQAEVEGIIADLKEQLKH